MSVLALSLGASRNPPAGPPRRHGSGCLVGTWLSNHNRCTSGVLGLFRVLVAVELWRSPLSSLSS